MRSSNLRLFGRLRPDRHVQRVETPAANHLFTQLDARLRSHRITLSTLASPYCKASTVNIMLNHIITLGLHQWILNNPKGTTRIYRGPPAALKVMLKILI